MTEPLTSVERRLLDELLQYQAARPSAAARPSPVRVRQPLPRRQLFGNLVVWAALLAVGIVLVVRVTGGGSSASAATPRPLHYVAPGPGGPTGRQLLLDLARTAERQATQVREPVGGYAYVKTSGWYRAVGQGADQQQPFPQTSQSWLSPAGHGEVISTTTGGSSRSREVVRPGSSPAFLTLATTPSVLRRQLAVGHPTSDGPQEQMVAFTDLASRQPIPLASESGILRLLSRIHGLVNQGNVIDRAGRHGIAVSLDSTLLGDRYTLIFDPRDGQLLGFEQTLIRPPPKLQLHRGAVMAYTTILASRYVARIGATR
jgi:hypothetical protein